ncbi:MAG: hypothetical protein ACHQNV_03985 [Vicinamibacteria bacterium]
MILEALVLLFRAVGLLLLVRMALRALAGLTRGASPRGPRSAPRGKPAADLVRDHVCNTFLPRDRALCVVIAGHEEHFCSAACRDKALAAASRAS